MSVSILGLALTPSNAATAANMGMPYEGYDKKECIIKSISNPLDGGTLSDKDCKVIYVKPPRYGISKVTAGAPTMLMGVCKAYLRGLAKYSELNKDNEDLEDKGRDAADEARISGVQNDVLFDDILGGLNNTNTYLTRLTNGLSANQSVALTAQLTLTTSWDQLVKQYKEANQDIIDSKQIEIRKLPIQLGVVTYASRISDDESYLGLTALNPVVSSVIHSVDDINLNGQRVGGSTPSTGIAKMSTTLNAQIALNLAGACPFSDGASQLLPKDFPKHLSAYIAPNYTYYYKVQTQSIYRIKINSDMVSKVIEENITNVGQLDSTTLASKLFNHEGSSAVTIETIEGYDSSKVPDDIKSTLKGKIVEALSIKMLASIGTLDKILPNGVEPKEPLNAVSQIKRSSRHCRRKWWGGRSCHTHNYSITVKNNYRKTKIREAVRKIKLDINVSGKNFSNFTASGTQAFVPGIGDILKYERANSGQNQPSPDAQPVTPEESKNEDLGEF